jgi:hypothetical protein
LNNNVYIAGCRALGIVDKLLTGPLWRQIESTKHILDLNQVWYTCLNNLPHEDCFFNSEKLAVLMKLAPGKVVT